MKILIATDAWKPQVNGVVTTISKIQEHSKNICLITPDDFKTHSNPVYPEIRLAFPSQSEITNLMEKHKPNYIHISTEGPIGFAVRKWCLKNKKKFTTSYHTKFPEFLQAFFKIPTFMTYWYFKRFHNSGNGMFVATESLAKDLQSRGFKNLISWSRGVDLNRFKPIDRSLNEKTNILLYVGRVSKEKNIEKFLNLNFPDYHKIIVGDGPELKNLKAKYKDVIFTGALKGEKLARMYALADCFVFPSKSDTFGIVMIEALACGTPVAAYPVTGPIDILNHKVGCMDNDLHTAVKNALLLNRQDCVEHAKNYTWENVVDSFIENVIKTNTKL